MRIHPKWPLAGVLSGLVVLASGTAPTEAHPGRAPLTRLQEQLSLSDDQVRALKEAYDRQWETRRQLAKALAGARRTLRELVMKGADEATIEAKTAEIRELTGRMVELGIKALRDLSQILTPEQRERFLQLPPWRRGFSPASSDAPPPQVSRLAVSGQIGL